MQVAVPRWSPDGRSIAFIGGLMSDEGVTGGDIYTVPATGGEARNLTPGPGGLRELARLAPVLAADPVRRARRRRQRPRPGRPGRESDTALGGRRADHRRWAGIRPCGVSASRDQGTLALIRQLLPRAAGGLGRCRPASGGRHAREPGDPAGVGRGEEPALEERRIRDPGLAALSPRDIDPAATLSDGRLGPRRVRPGRSRPRWLGADSLAADAVSPGLFRPDAQSARQLRPGRAVHAGQRQGLRLRRPPRHPRRASTRS